MKNKIKGKLKRNVGFIAAVSISMGTMIGAGIFVLPGIAISEAGSGAIISFAIAGLIALTAALSASELVSGMPKAGGSYHIINRSLGPAIGSVAGWGSWVGLVFKGSFAVVGFAYYFALFVHLPVVPVAIAAIVFLTFINVVGAKESGNTQVLMVIGLLIILVVFTGWGLSEVNFSNYKPLLPYGWDSVFTVAGLVFVSYVGLIKVLAIAEEIKNPRETIPKAIILSTIMIILLYILVMFVIAGVAPHGFFAGTETPVVEAAKIFMGDIGMTILAFAGLLATFSTGNAVILCSPRYLFAMSRDGLIPDWLSEVHGRFYTPYKSILVTAGAMILLVLFVDVIGLAELASAFNLVIFSLINVSVILMRVNKPIWFKPSFKSPGYPLVQIIGAIASLSLIPAMGAMPTIVALLFIFGGLGWYYLWGRDRVENKSVVLDISRGLRAKMALRRMDEIKNSPVDEGHYKILLPLRGTKYSKHLISIACAIAKKRNGRILVVKMMKLSPSVSFSSRMGMLGDELRETEEMLNQIVEDCRGLGVEAEATLISSYSPKKDILELAEKEGCNLMVLEWKGKLGRVKVLENVEEWVMQHASCDVVAFKDNKGIKEINKVLVSTPIGPYAEFTVSIAGSIAEFVGAKISFFRVINPRANKEEVEIIEDYQNKLANVSGVSAGTGSRKSSKVAEEIVCETENYDLVVMSASGDWVFKSIIFGSLSDEVIRKAKSSVIVVRKGVSKRESWLRRIRYTIWKPSRFNW